LVSIDSSLERPFRPLNLVPVELSTISFSKIVNVDKELLFDSFAHFENYPKILQNNILLVQSISETKPLYNILLVESGIKTELKVEHIIKSKNTQIMKVITGDAQGTVITQTFESIGNTTKISIIVDLKTRGILTPFSFLPLPNIHHAIDTIITSFVDYSNRSFTENEKIVDDLYREILLRPSDSQGLMHFSELLEQDKITENEIRNELLNSEEYRSNFLSTDLKEISELSDDTKNSLDELYNIVLRRDADTKGMQFFGSALEIGKMSLSDITIELLISNEFNSLPVETRDVRQTYMLNESWQIVNQTYYEIHDKYPKKKIIRAYGIFFEKDTLTLNDLKELFKN
jgi:hypothetical protein